MYTGRAAQWVSLKVVNQSIVSGSGWNRAGSQAWLRL
jgi:hypothetical protein